MELGLLSDAEDHKIGCSCYFSMRCTETLYSVYKFVDNHLGEVCCQSIYCNGFVLRQLGEIAAIF
jgi:hypothetical protein